MSLFIADIGFKRVVCSKSVRRTWIAAKLVEYYPEILALAIAFDPKGFLMDYDSSIQSIAEALDLNCSPFVIPKGGDYR